MINMFIRNKLFYYLCQNYMITHCKTLRINTVVAFFNSTSTLHNYAVSIKQDSGQKKVKPVNKFIKRTHTCGELNAKDTGEKVHLFGWLQYQRMGKFLILRDAYGLTQCIVPEERKDIWMSIQKLPYESVLHVIGTVVLRPENQKNKQLSTGEIEIVIDTVEISNPSSEKLPFNIRNFLKPTEQTGMKYRYLALRFPEMQTNLRLRSSVIAKMREYLLNQCQFIEVETPTLFLRTPGGAHEFVVPTKFPNKYYSLTQSPQQLKQLLMIGGIDRYFQVARCYRDETSRNDRQPEFTQMDIELSFVDTEGVMELTEELIKYSWPTHLDELITPFSRMTYEEALEQYGSENPDLTIPYKIENITEMFKFSTNLLKNSDINIDDSFRSYALVVPDAQKYLTKSIQQKLSDIAKRNFKNAKLLQIKIVGDSIFKKMDDLFSENIRKNIFEKMEVKEQDALFLTYGKKKNSQELIGRIRVEFVNSMESANHFIRSNDFKFNWVYDFPLFETKEDEQTLLSTHHPFTRPNADDLKYLTTDPLKVRGLHYDLILNGSEIAGGSIRIHEQNLQQKVLQLLKIQSSSMEYFLNALNYGTPPHGGIAIGLDRYISILCRAQSIRDVIAFPKTIEGNDVMTGAPTNISDKEKILYHLKTG